MLWEVRQIDAICEDNNWIWNSSILVLVFEFNAREGNRNVIRAFYRALKKYGIVFKPGRVFCVDDGNILEILDRKTKEPLFAAIPYEY